jgi:hydrogenase 3 maturation protease
MLEQPMDYLIMCIGNRDSGDDAIGPYIADRLKENNDNFVVLDCGIAPENYTSIVKKYKPKNLIIIDATKMGLSAGEIRIVPKEKIGSMHVSTHGIPISVLITYLEPYVENIVLIGIEPKVFSGKITDIVKKSGGRLVEIIKNKRLDEIETLQ